MSTQVKTYTACTEPQFWTSMKPMCFANQDYELFAYTNRVKVWYLLTKVNSILAKLLLLVFGQNSAPWSPDAAIWEQCFSASLPWPLKLLGPSYQLINHGIVQDIFFASFPWLRICSYRELVYDNPGSFLIVLAVVLVAQGIFYQNQQL